MTNYKSYFPYIENYNDKYNLSYVLTNTDIYNDNYYIFNIGIYKLLIHKDYIVNNKIVKLHTTILKFPEEINNYNKKNIRLEIINNTNNVFEVYVKDDNDNDNDTQDMDDTDNQDMDDNKIRNLTPNEVKVFNILCRVNTKNDKYKDLNKFSEIYKTYKNTNDTSYDNLHELFKIIVYYFTVQINIDRKDMDTILMNSDTDYYLLKGNSSNIEREIYNLTNEKVYNVINKIIFNNLCGNKDYIYTLYNYKILNEYANILKKANKYIIKYYNKNVDLKVLNIPSVLSTIKSIKLNNNNNHDILNVDYVNIESTDIYKFGCFVATLNDLYKIRIKRSDIIDENNNIYKLNVKEYNKVIDYAKKVFLYENNKFISINDYILEKQQILINKQKLINELKQKQIDKQNNLLINELEKNKIRIDDSIKMNCINNIINGIKEINKKIIITNNINNIISNINENIFNNKYDNSIKFIYELISAYNDIKDIDENLIFEFEKICMSNILIVYDKLFIKHFVENNYIIYVNGISNIGNLIINCQNLNLHVINDYIISNDRFYTIIYDKFINIYKNLLEHTNKIIKLSNIYKNILNQIKIIIDNNYTIVDNIKKVELIKKTSYIIGTTTKENLDNYIQYLNINENKLITYLNDTQYSFNVDEYIKNYNNLDYLYLVINNNQVHICSEINKILNEFEGFGGSIHTLVKNMLGGSLSDEKIIRKLNNETIRNKIKRYYELNSKKIKNNNEEYYNKLHELYISL